MIAETNWVMWNLMRLHDIVFLYIFTILYFTQEDLT